MLTILRACFVVGPAFDNPLARYLRKRFVFLPAKTEPLQYVHEDDLVRAMILLLQKRRGGVYNIAGDGLITFDEMVRLLGNTKISLPFASMYFLNKIAWGLRLTFHQRISQSHDEHAPLSLVGRKRQAEERSGISVSVYNPDGLSRLRRFCRAGQQNERITRSKQNKDDEKGGDVRGMIDGVREYGRKKDRDSRCCWFGFGIKVIMAPVEGWFQIGSPFSYWVLVKHWLASYYSS